MQRVAVFIVMLGVVMLSVASLFFCLSVDEMSVDKMTVVKKSQRRAPAQSHQGILTDRDGSVPLTSLYKLVQITYFLC